MRKFIAAGAALFAAVSVAGCSGQDDKSPYVEIRGGGFIFNYRIAEATEGFVAAPLRALPQGSALEASFENPAGGDAITIRQPVSPAQQKFDFVTPPLSGIKADKPYAVSLRLISADGKELERIDKSFHSQLDQSILPKAPLTIGPGYAKNPALEDDANTPTK